MHLKCTKNGYRKEETPYVQDATKERAKVIQTKMPSDIRHISVVSIHMRMCSEFNKAAAILHSLQHGYSQTSAAEIILQAYIL